MVRLPKLGLERGRKAVLRDDAVSHRPVVVGACAVANVIGLLETRSEFDIPFRALGQAVAFQFDGAEIVVLALEFGSRECDSALVVYIFEIYCFYDGILKF